MPNDPTSTVSTRCQETRIIVLDASSKVPLVPMENRRDINGPPCSPSSTLRKTDCTSSCWIVAPTVLWWLDIKAVNKCKSSRAPDMFLNRMSIDVLRMWSYALMPSTLRIVNIIPTQSVSALVGNAYWNDAHSISNTGELFRQSSINWRRKRPTSSTRPTSFLSTLLSLLSELSSGQRCNTLQTSTPLYRTRREELWRVRACNRLLSELSCGQHYNTLQTTTPLCLTRREELWDVCTCKRLNLTKKRVQRFSNSWATHSGPVGNEMKTCLWEASLI